MNPVTHLLVGWTVANSASLERRDRGIVTLAGVIPDVDGLGILIDLARDHGDGDLTWWWALHHNLAHNLTTAVLYSAVAFCVATRRSATAGLAFLAFHLHLLGDVVGSRGPDGYQWPISYLNPFSDAWQLTWSGQWELTAWPNFAITVLLLAWTVRIAWRDGRSPIEIVSLRADRAFTRRLRERFGESETAPGTEGRA
jgi:inner membrane protein